tara:strand:- start:2912 stop:3073 length:162 start_codon:yes stop_codon:yes gene_type:complete
VRQGESGTWPEANAAKDYESRRRFAEAQQRCLHWQRVQQRRLQQRRLQQRRLR